LIHLILTVTQPSHRLYNRSATNRNGWSRSFRIPVRSSTFETIRLVTRTHSMAGRAVPQADWRADRRLWNDSCSHFDGCIMTIFALSGKDKTVNATSAVLLVIFCNQ